MIVEILIFILTSLIAYFVYTHKKIHQKFDENGIKYLPGVPLVGNMWSSFARRHLVDDLDEVYKAFKDEKYVGLIENTTPIILVRDPDIIKNITVKDFDHFVDHKMFFPPELDVLFGDSVLMMKGERWRDMRTTLSPAFTGSKMRAMMPFMDEISNNVIQYIKENPAEEVDIDDLVRRYTNDVIASAGFGIQVNSVKDRDNEFYKLGQGLFKLTIAQKMKFMLTSVCPSVLKMFKMTLFPKGTTEFFRNLVSTTIEFRKNNNIERPDMIQLLMEASAGKLTHHGTIEKDSVGFATVNEALKPRSHVRDWTFDEITGQVFIFFVAGFESTATAAVMAIHEITINQEEQEKLYQEVRSFKENRGKLTYDNIGELKYLDCVLNETFRKWAAAIFMDRTCTKAYELPPPREGGKPHMVKPGDIVYNMVNTIHMDPEYFPDPHKFDPERFSDENKHKIRPFTFMPFGMGPRNCIGSRFALLELKIFMYYLILHFKFMKCAKTTDPIKLSSSADFNIKAQGGSWVKFEPRN